MYYPLYNNPFYYPTGAYIPNICSYGRIEPLNANYTSNSSINNDQNNLRNEIHSQSTTTNNDFFSINGDRLEVFGISINIDDLIILIMLFFLFRENQVDYSIIIILALILFDQN